MMHSTQLVPGAAPYPAVAAWVTVWLEKPAIPAKMVGNVRFGRTTRTCFVATFRVGHAEVRQRVLPRARLGGGREAAVRQGDGSGQGRRVGGVLRASLRVGREAVVDDERRDRHEDRGEQGHQDGDRAAVVVGARAGAASPCC
jgi:hypothetical protein